MRSGCWSISCVLPQRNGSSSSSVQWNAWISKNKAFLQLSSPSASAMFVLNFRAHCVWRHYRGSASPKQTAPTVTGPSSYYPACVRLCLCAEWEPLSLCTLKWVAVYLFYGYSERLAAAMMDRLLIVDFLPGKKKKRKQKVDVVLDGAITVVSCFSLLFSSLLPYTLCLPSSLSALRS